MKRKDSDDVSNEDDQDSDDTDDDDTDSQNDGDDANDDDTNDTDDDTADDTDDDADDEEEDQCAGLEEEDCARQHDDDGNQVCGRNVNTDECYEVVESRGIYGRGNFDEGYSSAQQEAEKDKSAMNLVIGIMGAVIGVLVLGILGGAYFVFQNQKAMEKEEEEYAMEMGDLEDGIAGDGIDTADSAALIANPVSPRSPRNVVTF